MKKPPKPTIKTEGIYTPGPFLHAQVGFHAKMLLSLCSQFRCYGCNLYTLTTNRNLAAMICCSYQQLLRAKRQLRDKNLLDSDGRPGSYEALKTSWEQRTGLTWEAYL